MVRYYKTWQLQGLAFVPSPYPPPWDEPTPVYGDIGEVQGFFRQDQSKEALIAATKGIATWGRFACDPLANLQPGDVLRSEEDVFIRLVGDPLVSPPFAAVQVKTYAAYITSRPTAESTAKETCVRGEVGV